MAEHEKRVCTIEYVLPMKTTIQVILFTFRFVKILKFIYDIYLKKKFRIYRITSLFITI